MTSKALSNKNGIVLLDPWNANNRLLTENDVYTILEKGGFTNARKIIKINDLKPYQTAFIHSSYVRKNIFDQNQSDKKIELTHKSSNVLNQFDELNDYKKIELTPKPSNVLDLFDELNDYENLEFMGDRVLEMSVAFYIYRKYPDSSQGFKTILKTKIVKKNTLAKFAEYLGFSKYLIVSKQVEENTLTNGRNNIRILEDVMEAFICALFLDQNKTTFYSNVVHKLENQRLIGPGWQIANALIENLIEAVLDFEELIMNEDNYKQLLLIYYQKEFRITPEYISICVEGPPNHRIYTLGVLDKDGHIICRAAGKSKQEAEQLVSKYALEYYGVMKEKNLI
jgi:ribonuclease-3